MMFKKTNKREAVMLRKTMFIGMLLLVFTLVSSTTAFAWNISNLFGWGSYLATFDIRGGQQPGTIGTFLASELAVDQAALICVNPGKWRQDVRSGKGGITILDFTSADDFLTYDERGRFFVDREYPYSVLEFAEAMYDGGNGPSGCNPDQSYDSLYANCSEAFNAFNALYNVSSADCRNDNWLPWAYLIQRVTLYGAIVVDCIDPANPSFETCTISADSSSAWATNEDPRHWAEDGNVVYTPVP